MRGRTAGAAGLLVALTAVPASPALPARTPGRPRLVVVLVVDQMRADYVDLFRHRWTGGLKRLLESGASFREAAYPYFNTVTCPGHATIATGTFPATHAVPLNEWWDRATARRVTCTEDAQAQNIGYGSAVGGGDSAHRLAAPTLAEELRGQLGPLSRAATVAVKARSAIMLTGHRAEAVTWFDPATGSWATSSAYAKAPVPFVEEFVRGHPVRGDVGKAWARRLPESAYLFSAPPVGAKPRFGWGPVLPHGVVLVKDTADLKLFEGWEATPFADAYAGRLAEAAIDSLNLGGGSSTDFLGVSFGTLDWVGHDFGPRSHEVQDVLLALDGVIGSLLDHLDRAVGRDGYVLALSADHGVAQVPEQRLADGLPAGRIVTEDVAASLNAALTPLLGPGSHVARMQVPDVYFAPGVYARLRANQAALEAAEAALRAVPGVARVFRGEDLERRGTMDDPLGRAAALSFVPGRSGDLVVAPRAYWFLVAASKETPPGRAAAHGTPYAYDQRVPLILMGAGVRPGDYRGPATPADIAPTLARLSGVTMPLAEGRVLSEALRPSPPDAGH